MQCINIMCLILYGNLLTKAARKSREYGNITVKKKQYIKLLIDFEVSF